MKNKMLAILWMILIFVSSSIPSDKFPEVNFWGWAKLIHLIYFGVLCFLLRHLLQDQQRYPFLARHALLFAILFAACYGVTDEIHQMFTRGRHAQAADVLVDALGASLYIAGAKTLEFLKLRRVSAG